MKEAGNAFSRSYTLTDNVDGEKGEAKLKYGVLRLHLPKSDAVKPKMIEIKAA